MSTEVDISVADRVLTIFFNRPDKKNAITRPMYEAMATALENLDPSVRVVLFTGAGGSFTAGNDLKDFLTAPPQDESHPTFRFIRALPKVPVPMVAAVQGVAVGVGTTMLLHCDLVLAAHDAQFSLPFVKLGLVPEAASSLLLPRLMGSLRAAHMLLLGEPINATQAEQWGLVTHLVAAGDLATAAQATVKKLLALPPTALRASKKLLRGDQSEITARMDQEVAIFAKCLVSPELKEAASAFLEKRAPDFSRF